MKTRMLAEGLGSLPRRRRWKYRSLPNRHGSRVVLAVWSTYRTGALRIDVGSEGIEVRVELIDLFLKGRYVSGHLFELPSAC